MFALRLLLAVLYLASAGAVSGESAYERAQALAKNAPSRYYGMSPRYTFKNIDDGISVPQYDTELHQYTEAPLFPLSLHPTTEERIALLEEAAQAGSVEAKVALGDIYAFGEHAVPVDYLRARSYYESAVADSPHGHAYFMLGFMYSTGLFGEMEMDKTKANVYYEFAAANDDLNALLVLAYQNFQGVGRPENCALAQFYYSRAARIAMKEAHRQGLDSSLEKLSHNIRIPDFNGGIFGPKVSESPSSVYTKVDRFLKTRDSLRDNDIDSHDSEMAEYYFEALQDYHGSYFLPKRWPNAFASALKCAYLGKKNVAGKEDWAVSNVDRYVYSRCMNLVGHMYVKGHGTERNLTRAYTWLTAAAAIYANDKDALDMAYLRMYDPVYTGKLSLGCQEALLQSINNGSAHAAFIYSNYLNGVRDDPFTPTYTSKTYSLLSSAAMAGHYASMFYFADAVESGFADSVGEQFTCTDLVSYYKMFVESSEDTLLPHLNYAFEALTYGDYKNALLGYAIAAEQGLSNAQVSASYLLHQMEPLFTWKRKVFDPIRVRDALRYLELASAQEDIDATILLGDIYSKGIPDANVSTDYSKAFAYYSKAASAASPHGCYKLGYMYEYGLGSANNTVDFFMAKRYYDLSVKYSQEYRVSKADDAKGNTYPIGIALLRLRLKLLLSRDKRDDYEDSSSGWFSTFKSLGKSQTTGEDNDRALEKAQAHHEGGRFDDVEEYEIFDYMVLMFTAFIFIFMFLRNFRRQAGVVRGAHNRENADDNAQANVNPAPGGNFQVFFFAI
ncbi:Sel1 repeat family protein [Clavispora lusitaniae]|uniref:Sel1 repeat family protein n=1 Tax=Clavispora lusitaniae TaxID=36911 RepID=UPI00202BF946|nr:Sel1 repeat family protein [Clavispora lusitaniae]